MLRPLPLARLLAGLAAIAALAHSGCVSPTKIAAVEGDTVLGPLQALVVETAEPLPAAPLSGQPKREGEAPAEPGATLKAKAQQELRPPEYVEPTVVAARPLAEPPQTVSILVAQQRETLPPPAASQQPMEPAALSQPSRPRRVKAIHEISLDITPVASGQDASGEIRPPANEGAAALLALAGDQPFTRGLAIEYGYDVVPAFGGLEMCYQPLYFQELNAERYGRSWGILQPAVSVANFYGRIPLLPYMSVSRPARRCTYHAHWALPGYRIPGREPHPLVISPAGGAAQTAALFGLILLIP